MSWDTQIFDCQERIATLLNADTFINDPIPARKIPVVTRRVGNIGQMVKEAIGKLGVVIIVMLPGAKNDGEAARISLGLSFVVMIKENPVINQAATGTQKPSEVIIAHVIRALHWQSNSATATHAQASKFKLDKNAFQLLRPTPGDAPLTYAATFNTEILL